MSAETSIPPLKLRRVLLFLSVVAIGAIATAVSGIADREKSRLEVAAWTNEQAVANVRLVQPERGSTEDDLVLPGNVSAYYSGTLFARA